MEAGLRSGAAAAALIAGYAHVKLYNDGYKDIPVGHIGTQFLLAALAALAIAVGLVAGLALRSLPPLLARVAAVGGVVWAAGSLVAFLTARSDRGWFDFRDQPGLQPSPEAALAVFPELVVLVSCLALSALALVRRGRPAAT